ncbi:MAG: hypothetical protein MAG794_00035 [Gammaproteobacteria bacterium]|nr:hypothetical protein [Gammaproteobacteria bacterium]
MELSARQGRLQHVAGVHRAFRGAGADHGVHFVDKQDDPPLLLGQIIQHRFQALLELTAILGTGHQRAHVEGQ